MSDLPGGPSSRSGKVFARSEVPSVKNAWNILETGKDV
jgi:hypothetical protein